MPLPDGYAVRPYTRGDAEPVVGLLNVVAQEPETAEGMNERFEKFPANLPSLRAVAEGEGGVVGFVASVPTGPPPDWAFLIRVHVDEGHQRRGIGRGLLELGEAFGSQHEADRFMIHMRDDLDCELRFFLNAGYRQVQHMWGVALDLSRYVASSEEHESIFRIVDWNEIGDTPETRRKLHELYFETDADTPGIENWGQDGFEEWAHLFDASWFRPAGCLIAIAPNGEWAGLHLIGVRSPGHYTTDFTGVRRPYRGSGLAMRLKRLGLAWAKAQGDGLVHTYNDDLNAPMRAINDALGFVRQYGWRSLRKEAT